MIYKILVSDSLAYGCRNGPHVPSPILVKDKLFTYNDMGISTCLDATTGKLLWTERLPDQFTASPIEAGGFIYVSGESGKTYVLKVSDNLNWRRRMILVHQFLLRLQLLMVIFCFERVMLFIA